MKTYNDHEVTLIGRLLYYVTSASRRGVTHLVDLEGDEFERGICSCEAFTIIGHRPCRHILACIDFIVDGIEDDHRRNELREKLEEFYAGEPVSKILPIRQDIGNEPRKRQYKLKAA